MIEKENAISLPVCRLFCGSTPGTLWPRPNGVVRVKNVMARLAPTEVEFKLINQTVKNDQFWTANEQRLREQVLAKVPHSVKLNDDGSRLMITIHVDNDDGKLNHDTNEHYYVQAYENTGVVIIQIKAETIFGARHALETISQLIIYDDIRSELQIVGEFEIDDRPAFPHRGFLLDTSRNYFSVESIKRTIGKIQFIRAIWMIKLRDFYIINLLGFSDGMALTKLNVFHWHITDSQSFPLVLKSHPDLSALGAYSPDKIYTIDDVVEVNLNIQELKAKFKVLLLLFCSSFIIMHMFVVLFCCRNSMHQLMLVKVGKRKM